SSGTVRQSWYGLALDKAEAKVWWSGGGYGKLHTFDLKDSKLAATSGAEPEPKKEPRAKKVDPEDPQPTQPFPSGLFLDESKGLLYSLLINSGELAIHNLKDDSAKKVTIGGRPYDIVLGPGGHQLFVSDWAGRQVLVIDPAELRVVRKIGVGEHPNQMALHP